MNTKRIIFWFSFIVILGLIIWGLVAAMNKPVKDASDNYAAAPAVTGADHVLGPDNAKVTLIEYGDFQCPACGAYAPIVERLSKESATGTMRVVFRHFPLPMHANALIAAYAAEAAGKQGKFWEMYRLLYANQTTWSDDKSDVAISEFEGYARQLDLNVTKFRTDSADPAVKKIVDDQKNEAQALALDYTPTFYVNGKVVSNTKLQGYEPFKAIIDAAAK